MARGITQDQVSAAADALVTAGERPTVEKIRAQLGTGSPNTVTRMLDTWRGALATRLSQVLALPEVPADVGQAFTEIWRLAMTHAGSLAQAALAHEQNALLATQSSLTQERKLWEIAVAEAQAQAQSADQAREVAETRLADLQRLVEQQAGQLAELLQQRDGWQQRADQLAEAFDTHKSGVAAEREAQAAHVRAVEDRAHAEIDRAREETKALQATLRQKERETSTIASRLEAAVTSVRAAEHLATEQGARAKTLEQQLARMDGVPAALLAAQQSLQAALQRETVLQAKLDHLVTSTKIQPAVRKQKSRKASGAA
jgi:chromosome segregation ATPase